MKKPVLTLLFALIATFIFAQNVNFGIKAGPNFSILNYDPHYNAFEAGFNAGAYVDLGLHNWSIQPGLFFTTKGETINDVQVFVNSNPTGR